MIARLSHALTLGLILLALPLAGIGADPERPRIVLAVGGQTTLYYLPLALAARLGYFEEEGLSVEIQDFPGGAKALQALVGGSADVVSGAFEHTIVMQTMAQKLQAFVLQGTNPGLQLGIVAGRAQKYAWPRDLKGMRVGVSAPGSSTHMLVNHLLASVGLTPDDVSIIGVGTGAQAVAAVRSGELDALSSVDPVMTLLENQGLIRIVHETTTVKGAREVFGGSLPAACPYAKKAFVERYPDTVQALTNAIVRSLVWLRTATAEQVAQTVPPEYLLGDRGLYLDAFERVRLTYSSDGRIDPKAVKMSHRVLLEHNQAVRRAPVLFLEQTYTNAFVDKALARFAR
ncbi:MAG: ABC transporter substrate-binding protein [Burkholderiales bacterium]|nr:ABC transporter substrate-binding protein [Burkholderiales bacterium]